jgi:hypothetical protein
MSEIIEIVYIFLIFNLFSMSPLNIFHKNVINFNYLNKDNFFFNLILNLNILLFFSLSTLKLPEYTMTIIIILILFFIKNYFFSFKNLKDYSYNITFFFIVFFILSIQVASVLNLGWDAKWFWYIKSLYFSDNQTFKELSNYVYNDYHPHLGSFVWSFFKELSFNKYEYMGRLFYVFFYITGIFFITKDIFKNKLKNIITFLLIIFITHKYIYFSGLQEILIFTTLIYMSKFLYNFLKDRSPIYLFFILLSANLLIWLKAEGIAYALIFLISVNFISKLNLKQRILINISFLFIIFFKILIYKFFQIKVNDQPYYIDYIANLDLTTLFYKIKYILLYLSYYSFKNIILMFVPIIIIFNYKKIIQNEYLKLISIIFLMNIVFIFSAYIFRDMEVVYSLKTTIDRIVFSSSGFYLLLIIKEFKNFFSRYI